MLKKENTVKPDHIYEPNNGMTNIISKVQVKSGYIKMNKEALRKMIYLPKTVFDGERGHVWLTKLFNKILSAKSNEWQ